MFISVSSSFEEIEFDDFDFYAEGVKLEDRQIVNFLISKRGCSHLKIFLHKKERRQRCVSAPSTSTATHSSGTLAFNKTGLLSFLKQDSMLAEIIISQNCLPHTNLIIAGAYKFLVKHSRGTEFPLEHQIAVANAVSMLFPKIDADTASMKLRNKIKNVKQKSKRIRLQQPEQSEQPEPCKNS